MANPGTVSARQLPPGVDESSTAYRKTMADRLDSLLTLDMSGSLP
jgi:hypothetical protein